MKGVLRLYPRAWRDRYAAEVEEVLARSDRARRDHVNLAVHAPVAWLQVPAVATVLRLVAASSLLLFGFAVGQLSDGVSEVPAHWWSSAAAVLALSAVAVSAFSDRSVKRLT